MPLDRVLHDVLAAARRHDRSDVGLYVVELHDPTGLALAVHLCETVGGPDPVDLYVRALAEGLETPQMVAAAPAPALAEAARVCSSVGPSAASKSAGRGLGAGAFRGALGSSARVRGDAQSDVSGAVLTIARSGGVPLLLVSNHTMIVAELDEHVAAHTGQDPEDFGGWSVPAVGRA